MTRTQPVNDFNVFINFLSENRENYADMLSKSPYCVNSKPVPYNPNWVMFKYSQFESDFTNPIVRCARGSVFEITKDAVKPICLPFYKFANYGEAGEDIINWSKALVELKVDGNLIKAVKHDGKIYFFTNGGFVENEIACSVPSKYDEKETEHCRTYKNLIDYAFYKNSDGKWIDGVPDETTMMFELTGPHNRIIVEYEHTQLWFLGARDNVSMKEYDREEFKKNYSVPFDVPPVLDVHDIDNVVKTLSSWGGDKEGVVIVDDSFRRIKIKSDAYRKLKFVKGEGNFSEKSIFNFIMDGSIDDALSAYPAIKSSVENIEKNIISWKQSQKDIISEGYNKYISFAGDEKQKRKQLAQWAKDRPDFHTVMLCLASNDAKEKFFNSFSYEEYKNIFKSKEQ
jgi:hypothetical protein